MTIGSQLKQTRINKGISLQEASTKTKIQERYLQALEDDNIASLPNPIYAKGFLKTYAQFLGLDANVLIDELQNAGTAKAEQIISLKGKELPAVDSEKYLKRFFLVIIGFLVFIGAVVFLWSFSHRPPYGGRQLRRPAIVLQKKKAVKQNKPKPQDIKQAKPIAVKPAPKPAAPAFTTTSQQPVSVMNLSVTARRLCRLSVKSDGKLLFEDFLLAGKSEQWQAKRSFELNISDGSAIDLFLNGRRIGSAGKGPRNNVLITKDGIK